VPSSALERGIFSLSNALLGTSELPVQRPTQLVEYLPQETFFSPVLSGAADLFLCQRAMSLRRFGCNQTQLIERKKGPLP